MTTLLRPRRCVTCGHSLRRPNSELECHFNPPSAHPVVVMTPNGPQCPAKITVWPVVQDDEHCGQWKPRIITDQVAGAA